MQINLEEALKIYREKYHRYPKLYVMTLDVDNSMDFTDHQNNLPTKEEWEVMKVIIDHFYKGLTDEGIEAHNNRNRQQLYESMTKTVTRSKKKHEGYVYFIKADNGLTKIGKAKNLKKRLDHFTAKLPYKLELVHSIKTSDSLEFEKYFNEKFANKRKRGEWFELTADDLEEVKNDG